MLESSDLYQRYRRYLDDPDGCPAYIKVYDQKNGSYSLHRMQVLGICQDTLSAPRKDATGATVANKAGLTFGWNDIYAYGTDGTNGTFDCRMNDSGSSLGGWGSSSMKGRLNTTFKGLLGPALQADIVSVNKNQQLYVGTSPSLQSTTQESVWIPSVFEVYGGVFSYHNDSEGGSANGYAPFQYQGFEGNAGQFTNLKAIKTYDGVESMWSLRSAARGSNRLFCIVALPNGRGGSNYADGGFGIVPCFAL